MRRRSTYGVVLAIVVCAVQALTVLPAAAQATAQISGTVRDASNAVLPGVTVTATQTDTGIARTTVTDENGLYVLTALLLGPYKLEAALAGFRTSVQTDLVLRVNASPVNNIKLEIGEVAETILVKGEVTSIETRSVGISTVTARVEDLPINGRQSTDLITLSGLAVLTWTAPAYTMKKGGKIFLAGSTNYNVHDNLDWARPWGVYS